MPIKSTPPSLETLCVDKVLDAFLQLTTWYLTDRPTSAYPKNANICKKPQDLVDVVFKPYSNRPKQSPLHMLPGRVVELLGDAACRSDDILALMVAVHPEVRRLDTHQPDAGGDHVRSLKFAILKQVADMCKGLHELRIPAMTLAENTISQLFGSFTQLRVLDMAHSSVGDEGMRVLARVCPQLESICVAYCKYITDHTAIFLSARYGAVDQHAFPKLVKLDVDHSKMTMGSVMSIIYYRPSLKLLHCPSYTGKALVTLVHEWPQLKPCEGFAFLPRKQTLYEENDIKLKEYVKKYNKGGIKYKAATAKGAKSAKRFSSVVVEKKTTKTKTEESATVASPDVNTPYALTDFTWMKMPAKAVKAMGIKSIDQYKEVFVDMFPMVQSLSIETASGNFTVEALPILSLYGKALTKVSLSGTKDVDLSKLTSTCPNIGQLKLEDNTWKQSEGAITTLMGLRVVEVTDAFLNLEDIRKLLECAPNVEQLVLTIKSKVSASQFLEKVFVSALSKHGFLKLQTIKLVDLQGITACSVLPLLEDDVLPSLATLNIYHCNDFSREDRKQVAKVIKNNNLALSFKIM